MKNQLFLFFLVISIILTCCKSEKSMSAPAKSIENPCIITSMEGTVYLSDDEGVKKTEIVVGDKLKESDFIKTGNSSFVELQLGTSSIVRIKENSILQIAKISGDTKSTATNLFLKSGKLLANPEKQTEGSSFVVSTESTTAGVRGTSFSVIVEGIDLKKKSVAIIPFTNIGENNNYDFITDSLRDSLKASLSSKSNLKFLEYSGIDNKVDSNLSKTINDISSDLLIAGNYKINDDKIEVETEVFDSKNNKIFSQKITGIIGIEIFSIMNQIGNQINISIDDRFPDKAITKIAVNEGEIILQKNINIDEINKIKDINPNLAKKLEKSLNKTVVIKPGEKVEIKNQAVRKIESNLNVVIAEYTQRIESNKDSKNELRNISIEMEQNKTIKELTTLTSPITKVEKIKIEERNTTYSLNEFEAINKKQHEVQKKIISSEKVLETSQTSSQNEIAKANLEKENKAIETQENKNIVNETISKKNENIFDFGNIRKTEKEKQKTLSYSFEKIVSGLNINLSEAKTSIVNDDEYLYITSVDNNSIYCIDLKNGNIKWTFSDPKKTNLQNSPAVLFKDNIVLSTYKNIIVLDKTKNGKMKFAKDIISGSGFWSFPIEYKENLIIPVSKALYTFDGKNINYIDSFKDSYGQLNIASLNEKLFVVDLVYASIKEFDLETKTIIWSSDKINKNIYTTPVFAGKYLIAGDIENNLYRFDYETKKTTPDILRIGTGILSNIISVENNIYFIGKDGYFYKADILNFTSEKIARVDTKPEINKYMTKKSIFFDNKILFPSDTGKLFTYDIGTNTFQFMESPDKNDNPLIGSPLKIENTVYILDNKANVYKFTGTYN
jgi:outer membrane protein assembly factor BamB/TolB-like protein